MTRPIFQDLENLEARILMATGPVFGSATPINTPALGAVTVNNTFSAATETDTFTFVAKASGLVTVDVFAGGTRANATATAYGANGGQIATITNGTLRVCVNNGYTYYITAANAHSYIGQYTMTLTAAPTDDCGNTMATATVLSVPANQTVSGLTAIQYAGDVDMFSFVAKQSGKATIDMQAVGSLSPGVDPELFAYDASGNLVAQNDNYVGLNAHVSFSIVAGQTYYFAATGHNGSIGGSSLTITSGMDLPPAPPNPTQLPPGSTITGAVYSTTGGVELLILGTNGNDTITLSQSAAAVLMTTSAGTQTFAGSFVSIVICGFGGNDVIRLTNAVTSAATVYCGDGQDTVYDAGKGADTLICGAGADQIVSIGGGRDVIYGGAGLDSIWADTGDALSGITAAETAAMSIHQVGSFYQSLSTDIAGQNLADPNSGGYAYRSFASNPLFANGPDYNDIHQGAVGDCYFVSSLSSFADQNANVIRQMITPLGDGTYAVRFFRNSQAVYVRIDADLPVYSNGAPVFAGLSPQGETWVALTEKAFAFFRTGANSYASLAMGNMSEVYFDITNSVATTLATNGDATALTTSIQTALNAGKAVTAGSWSNLSGPIVGNHSYEVKSIEITTAGTFVTVYNPWGYDGTNYDSNPSDGLLRLSLADFRNYFMFLTVSK